MIVTWLAVMLLARITFAQPGAAISVIVATANDDGIGNATVGLWPGAQHLSTDESGRVVFRELSGGTYRIVATFPGYVEADTLCDLDAGEWLSVRMVLSEVRHVLPEVAVESRRLPAESAIYSQRSIRSSGARDLPEFLRVVAGLDVRSDGTPAAASTVRVGGSAPNQVLLLVDGRVLRNPGTGEPDFSGVPLEWVESIEVHRGSRTELGGQAIGGIVSITTTSPQRVPGFSVAGESSGFYTRTSFNGNASVGTIGSLLQFARIQGPGNYRYRVTEDDGVGPFTPDLGREFRRENGDVARDQLMLKLESVRSGRSVAVTGTLDRTQRGMPGYIAPRLTPLARQSSLQQSLNCRFRQSRSRIGFESGFSVQRDQRRYEDPDPYSVVHSSDERSTQEEAQALVDSRINSIIVSAGGGVNRETLRSTRLASGFTRRLSWSTWTRLRRPFIQLKRLRFTSGVFSGVRFERVGDSNALLPRLGVSWVWERSFDLQGQIAWSRSYRSPDLYAMFWQDDQLARGNPDLQPEHSDECTARFAAESGRNIASRLEAEVSIQKVKDLIEWRRTPDSQWKPYNLQEAAVRTLDVSFGQRLPVGNVDLQFGMNWTEARDGSDDRNTGGRYLTFRAPRSWRTAVRLEECGLKLLATHRWVARRPVTDTNSKWLTEYAITDMQVSYGSRWGRVSAETHVGVNNLFDTQYRIIRFAPMPGREIVVGLKLSEDGS